MLLLDGVLRIRDLLVADLFKGQLGTGTTEETEDDTALVTPDAATLIAITSTTSGRTVTVEYNLPGTGGIGTTYKEYEAQLNSGAFFNITS